MLQNTAHRLCCFVGVAMVFNDESTFFEQFNKYNKGNDEIKSWLASKRGKFLIRQTLGEAGNVNFTRFRIHHWSVCGVGVVCVLFYLIAALFIVMIYTF